MKHLIFLILGLMLAGEAFASQARMGGLGQDRQRGSFFLDDTRNVWRNPAALNDMNNYAEMSWGEDPEGGFFRDGGRRGMSYGVYLGYDGYTQAPRATGYADNGGYGLTNSIGHDGELDFFWAGDRGGMDWGVHFHYAARETVSGANEASTTAFSAGIMRSRYSLYFDIVLGDEYTVGTATHEGSMMRFGGTYNWRRYKLYGEYAAMSREMGAEETEQSDLTLGIARVRKLSSRSSMFYDLSYRTTAAEDTGTISGKLDVAELPLTIGYEVSATSWLTFRGAISQRFFVGSSDDDGTEASSGGTSVSAGVGFNYGRFKIDGELVAAQTGKILSLRWCGSW